MLAWLGLAVTLAASAGSSPNPDIGGCAWGALPKSDRAAVLEAYKLETEAGMVALRERDGAVRKAVERCAGIKDIPRLWAAGAVASVAIQEGVSQQLSASGISRSALERAWIEAPEAARQCTRANAAKAFGLTNEPCPDRAAPAAFIRTLGVDPVANRATAMQIVFFMNARAQEMWANGLIMRLVEQGPPAR